MADTRHDEILGGSSEGTDPKPWMGWVLVAAGIYNLAWGAAVIAAPTALFRWAEMELPRYPQIWQCVGMIVGVYGVGYLIAARDPHRHWPIVLVGLLGKLFGPAGFLSAAVTGALPWKWGVTILTNDLIWWVPFTLILLSAWRAAGRAGEVLQVDTSADDECVSEENRPSRTLLSQRGASIATLSDQAPVLVVFVRHAGCTFCRESLTQLAQVRRSVEQAGVTLALVHMSPPMDGTRLMNRYGLGDLHRFSDPQRSLYREFGLQRATLNHLFGPAIWMPAVRALADGHGIGLPAGDVFQKHGAFLVHRSQVLRSFLPESAADQADFLQLACGAGPALDVDAVQPRFDGGGQSAGENISEQAS